MEKKYSPYGDELILGWDEDAVPVVWNYSSAHCFVSSASQKRIERFIASLASQAISNRHTNVYMFCNERIRHQIECDPEELDVLRFTKSFDSAGFLMNEVLRELRLRYKIINKYGKKSYLDISDVKFPVLLFFFAENDRNAAEDFYIKNGDETDAPEGTPTTKDLLNYLDQGLLEIARKGSDVGIHCVFIAENGKTRVHPEVLANMGLRIQLGSVNHEETNRKILPIETWESKEYLKFPHAAMLGDSRFVQKLYTIEPDLTEKETTPENYRGERR